MHYGTHSYKVTWVCDSKTSQTRWSADAVHIGDALLGTLHITIPHIFLTVRWTCSSIERLLNAKIEDIIKHWK